MEIEVKKTNEGDTFCCLKEGAYEGASFNLEQMFKSLSYDFSDYSFEYDLASLGFRHALLALESDDLDDNLSNYKGDLYLIESLLNAAVKSISRVGFTTQMKHLKNHYETELLAANKDKKEATEAFCDARNTIEEYLSKNMNLQNENEELKERIQFLKSKIEKLEKENGTKN